MVPTVLYPVPQLRRTNFLRFIISKCTLHTMLLDVGLVRRNEFGDPTMTDCVRHTVKITPTLRSYITSSSNIIPPIKLNNF